MSFNLISSNSVKQDHELKKEGHIFLGAVKDKKGNGIHIWLRKGMRTSETVPCNWCLDNRNEMIEK